nr:DUF2642 domain-containing protein [Paenibacillus shirakamiensis]
MNYAPGSQYPITVNPSDLFVVEALKTTKGKCVLFETTRGRLEGVVCEVKPDHVVLQNRGKNFYLRIAEIVWIMPD